MKKRYHREHEKEIEIFGSEREEHSRPSGLGTAVGNTKGKSFFGKKKESAW